MDSELGDINSKLDYLYIRTIKSQSTILPLMILQVKNKHLLFVQGTRAQIFMI